MEQSARNGPLSPYRVLDLTNENGWLAGKVLADLGADVIKVEPVGGDPGRARPSDAPGTAGREPGLPWLAENRGKRSVTLDLAATDGRAALLRLVRGAHAVLESSGPGRLESLRLGFDDLAAVNPLIVLTRISAFGQSGPYAQYAASDLILSAIGGASWLCGDEDRPPTRITAPQYFRHAAVEAVVHTCAALYHARETGAGQQIDVSAQLATIRTLMNGFIHAYTDGALIRREAFGAPHPRYPVPSLYRCADGYIMALVGARPGLAGYLAWAGEEGVAPPPPLAGLTQEELGSGPAIFASRPGFADVVTAFLADFFATRTRAELAAGALRRRMLFATLSTLADFRGDEQLTARGYFTDVAGPDGRTLGYPTYWARLSRTPLAATGAPPAAGADNAAILGAEEAGAEEAGAEEAGAEEAGAEEAGAEEGSA